MKPLLALLAVITIGTGLNASNLTIAKRIRIDTGSQSYPLGSPTNWLKGAYPLNDGGYLVVGCVSTNYAWQRFTPTGALVWSNQLQIAEPSAFAELLDGRLACLTHAVGDNIPHNSLFVIDPDGSGPTQYSLPLPAATQSGWDIAEYTTLLAETNGVLVGGYGNDVSDSYQSNFVMKLSTNFAKVWQSDYSVYRHGYEPMATLAARRQGGYFFAYNGYPSGNSWPFQYHTFAAVSTNGTVVGSTQLYGSITNINMDDQLVTMIPCSDGGLLVGFSSTTVTGGAKTAPDYGQSDIWLVRLGTNGKPRWDRSFGGAGSELLGSVQQTVDGGFLVASWTMNSQVSGNKTVDGNGIWLLKLDGDGFKEGEFVIQEVNAPPFALLPAPTGCRLAATSWIVDLNVRWVIDLTATPTGKPFKLDYSYDLVNWTNIVNRYNGTINIEEDMEAGKKFYRCAEVP